MTAPAAPGGDLQDLIDAVRSPVRREILWLVWDRALTAGEIAAAFPLRAPTISAHLAVLRRTGLVAMTRQGTFRHYRARPEVVGRLRGLLAEGDARWTPSGSAEPGLPSRRVAAVVTGAVVDLDPPDVFRAFTDPVAYSRWAGVPVTIDDGRFALTTPWGVEVRGVYEIQVAPSLIVMRWDVGRGEPPIPGDGVRAYLEISAVDGGTRVQVTQLTRSDGEAAFMERAWGLMLARFAADAGAPLRS